MKTFGKQLFVTLVAVLMLAPVASKAQAWSSDPIHSTVMYTVRHVMTPMLGVFKKFDVNITWDAANLGASTIDATLDAASVQMGMDKLEGHLKSADFFDVATYPTWTFKSTSIVKGKKSKAGASYIANGKLTVRGVTKDVAIPFIFLGVMDTGHGNKAGFSADFTINRVDYGVGNADTKMLGGDVKITVLLEMNPKN
jgi:polyisoprenoid-binding protein YceI